MSVMGLAAISSSDRSDTSIGSFLRSISPSVKSTSVSSALSWMDVSSIDRLWIRAEEQPGGRRQLARGPGTDQDRREMACPGPAQDPAAGIVDPADNGADDVVGEVARGAVEPAEQGSRACAGQGQPAQAIAQRDHAGDRIDAVPSHISHDEHDALVR